MAVKYISQGRNFYRFIILLQSMLYLRFVVVCPLPDCTRLAYPVLRVPLVAGVKSHWATLFGREGWSLAHHAPRLL